MQSGKSLNRCYLPASTLAAYREVDFRQVLNAIFYRADNGLKWRASAEAIPDLANGVRILPPVGEIRGVGAN